MILHYVLVVCIRTLSEVDNFYATLLTPFKVIVKKTFGLLFCGHGVYMIDIFSKNIVSSSGIIEPCCSVAHPLNVLLSGPQSLSLSLSLSVSFEGHFSSCIWVSQLQNVSILNFIGAKDGGDGGNKWSYKTCKALNRGH